MLKILSLESFAIEKLGEIAETRYRLYTGRIYLEPHEIYKIERRYKHLASITTIFETVKVEQGEEGGAA